MTHLALYRAWRPMHFDEVVEQKHAVFALRQAVISDQIGHAYLFSGTRGTGKTTLAKIFSRAINCLNPDKGNPCNTCVICKGILDGSLMDVVEMDAASNNSVDNIRRICDEVVFMPSQAKYKVYIIDEVHMLSTGAFNALLKTLEEPPAHAVFILATTEPHRIPATILSRCQRYDFRRIPVDGMIGRLAEIAKADQINISNDALRTIAMLADGAMRDAISLLDQARMRYTDSISRDDILALAGIVQDEFMILMAKAIHNGQPSTLLDLIEQLIMDGRDLAHFVTDLAQFYRNLLVCRVSRKPQELIRAPSDALKHMLALSRMGKPNEWVTMIQGLSGLLSEIRWSSDARTTLEIGLIKLMDEQVLLKTALETEEASINQIEASTPAKQATETVPVDEANKAEPAAQAKEPTPAKQTTTWDASFPDEPPPEDDSDYVPDPPFSSDTANAAPANNAKTKSEVGLKENSDYDPDPPLSSDGIRADSETIAKDKSEIGLEITSDANAEISADIDVEAIWQQVSNRLQQNGHMTTYLFSRPASVSASGPKLILVFRAAEAVHYAEISKTESVKLIRQFASEAAGRQIAVEVQLQGTSKSPEKKEAIKNNPTWIDTVTETAKELGIPVKMEE